MNDNYTLITVLGAVASCIFAIISISELIEFRFEKKASYLAIWIYSVFHILMVLAIYNRFGSATGGQLYMIFGTIPPVIFFLSSLCTGTDGCSFAFLRSRSSC